MRFGEDSSLVKFTELTNLLVDEFNLSLETNGGDSPCHNGENDHYNIMTHNMVILALIYNNQHVNKPFFG